VFFPRNHFQNELVSDRPRWSSSGGLERACGRVFQFVPVVDRAGFGVGRSRYESTVADDGLLGIYLNDHLAGSAAAVQRCRYSAGRASGELGEFLEQLAGEIEADRSTLQRVMESVGARISPVKQPIGRLLERLGRLKPNGHLIGQSPLTLLVELELLSLGIEGKRRLWLALEELREPRLADFDFVALSDRADRQREGIEKHRLAAARSAFS
jgi:hypothetical protein